MKYSYINPLCISLNIINCIFINRLLFTSTLAIDHFSNKIDFVASFKFTCFSLKKSIRTILIYTSKILLKSFLILPMSEK